MGGKERWVGVPDSPIKLEDHSARHEKDGADEISLAGLTVLGQDIDFTLEEVAVATTLSSSHYLVVVDTSAGDIVITLPASASHTNRIYTIKKIDSSSHKVTIDANGDEEIDGEETIDLQLQYSYVTTVCDGDEWFIIGGEYVKMEDTLDDLKIEQKTTNTRLLKALFYLASMLKHEEDSSEADPDQKDIEREISELEIKD